ncbi:Vacuolar protein sorting-associated protein 51 [Fulvia fulva]|uniref:Vacuolar protein sorting-associated protein 51 homolog n=1 Tax=Passalora fulva TaxID=5499 RepID=A0A9Q8PIJ6_PASFU|nr:Vacuolar protein sorting-associated protein 51 [Fulvia fulva]KAK4611799.1 Vacuolar protein sorting-associated protein 51 [Fulvia fulva]KAK4613066.1 Vacuolar protein sorting-associated protein 51 [Fulvia fulva]UJO23309.1 Vacuolar protein sorting-associated protein 51 [Fulvia fulva]WPV21394.1 Vacuolar protein sorting-associated protein 51 [Fulvia fulva]WPV36555.1 Vacuolar protein sorting-associated protein 51 [Fulvia fulva]
MSTIASPRASPRPSLSLSSRRGSASTDVTVTSASSKLAPPAVERGSLRRNRTALRDYYNLQTNASSTSIAENATPTLDPDQDSELDKLNFSPDEYVQSLLAREGLEGVLRVEAGLVSDIRSLDGEKKALVYDNYSKFIKATDTIRVMRERMDPMMPGTGTLGAAVGHIAETAAELQKELRDGSGGSGGGKSVKRMLVRWVLNAPERLGKMRESGREKEARLEWEKVEGCLEKWKGVNGVEDVRRACEEVMGREAAG